jgi:glyoxylase-like metal-dependent hydrolase (beta-lactamase superfamily II)
MQSNRVADLWYSVKHFSDDISLITEIHVADWLRCNIWHIKGKSHDFLIDSGMGLRPLKKEVATLIGREIRSISTHCHFDHIGGAHEFDCRLGHQLEADIYVNPTHDNTAVGSFVRAETFSALPYEGFHYSDFEVKAAPLTGFLDEGDVVDLGNRAFNILHLPGHSPGSIALWEEKTGILFSGDTIYQGGLYDSVYHSDKELYRESLSRLRELPVKCVHGGHEESFGKAKMISLIDDYFDGKGIIGNSESWVDSQIDNLDEN